MTRPARYVTFDDRLLAEAVRSHEHASPIDHPPAAEAARAGGGDLEQRLVTRASHLPISEPLRHALRQLNTALGWVIAVGALVALLAGAATARATLGVDGDGVANFFWVLGGILLVQNLALLLWLGAFIATIWFGRKADSASRPSAAISLGSMVIAAAQWLVRKVHHDDAHHAAAAAAATRVHGSGVLGRWTFSCITHGLWLAFNVGCLVMVIVLLSARQYTFVWETTILSERNYVQLTHALAAIPRAVGFDSPTEQQIIASRRTAERSLPGNAREAWSSLLVGSIIMYGFGPRLLLLGLSLSCRRSAKGRFRLDTTQPGYARLEYIVSDQPARILETPSESAADAAVGSPPADRPARPPGAPAVVGIEIPRPESGWPPPLPEVDGLTWHDLGLLENRDDQQRAITALEEASTEPARLAIVCDLTTTPDRGIRRLVRQLRQTLTQPPMLLLTGGHALRSRGRDAEHVSQRVQDWRQLAQDAAIAEQDVVEVDLDHLTDRSLEHLARRLNLNGHAPAVPSERHLDAAFAMITQHVQRWKENDTPPDVAAQAELHRAIAQLYRSGAGNWRSLLQAPATLDAREIGQSLQSSAQRVVQLLPDRLRRSPRWLAAGAMSGALGCIAAATLLSPVAIAALPTWSLIGAAIAAVAQPGSRDTDPGSQAAADYAEPVRAAALFALLLELQGRDEATITRILDEVLDDGETLITDHHDAHRLLEPIQRRLHAALSEARS